MRDSVANDYFSFMSDKWATKGRPPSPTPKHSLKAAKPPLSGDIVEYVEEPTIVVVESEASDTIIERVFKQFRVNDG
jgi:hypothetical protein